MEIYNKAYFFIGLILFNAGLIFDCFTGYSGIFLYLLMALGVIFMIVSFRKPQKPKIDM